MSDALFRIYVPSEPVWMVVRDGFARTADVTFGPFETREKAEEFCRSPYGGIVYDAVQDRRSLCGPWLP